MPAMPPKPCTNPGCTEHATKKGRCDKHQVKHGWAHTKNRHERGYDNNWYRLRSKILKRDNYLCQVCKKEGRLTKAEEVDHIINKASGGTDNEENLQGICKYHHKIKTSQESVQAGEC